MPELLARDFEYIYNCTRDFWDDLRGGRIFITGGTGFIGCWLLESFIRANDRLLLNAQAVVLTRDPMAFQRKAPHLVAHPAIQLHQGDVRNFDFPGGRFTHVIHAATQRDVNLFAKHPMRMLNTVLSGMRHVLDFTLQSGNPKFLLISSGEVYGSQPVHLTHIPEDYPGKPDAHDPRSVLSESKRLSELLSLTYGQHYGIQVKIARCFSYIGPYQSLDNSCMISNFIRDGLRGGPIQLNGNGSSCCSYLYAADLAVWLWTILIRGETCRPYNVGSEQAITYHDLAHLVGQMFHPPVAVTIVPSGSPAALPERYVPSTQVAREALQLEQPLSLEDALQRTIEWYQSL